MCVHSFVSYPLILIASAFPFPTVACPTLAKIPQVLVIHGEGDGTVDHMKVSLTSVYNNLS